MPAAAMLAAKLGIKEARATRLGGNCDTTLSPLASTTKSEYYYQVGADENRTQKTERKKDLKYISTFLV